MNKIFVAMAALAAPMVLSAAPAQALSFAAADGFVQVFIEETGGADVSIVPFDFSVADQTGAATSSAQPIVEIPGPSVAGALPADAFMEVVVDADAGPGVGLSDATAEVTLTFLIDNSLGNADAVVELGIQTTLLSGVSAGPGGYAFAQLTLESSGFDGDELRGVDNDTLLFPGNDSLIEQFTLTATVLAGEFAEVSLSLFGTVIAQSDDAVIPVPAALPLLGLGVASLVGLRRRRRAAA